MFASAQEIYAVRDSVYRYRNMRSIADAEALLNSVLEDALENEQDCKEHRPWEIVDFSEKLDADDTWIGFEFETGFDSKKEYQTFIRWLWDQPYVAIDREGTGDYPVEVAFPPQTLADIAKNGHLLTHCLGFIHKKELTPALNPTTFTCRDVGIHAGISTAKWRDADYNAQSKAVRKLADILYQLTDKQMDELYGRHELHWETAHNRYTYVELKMFRAIPELERVNGYIDVTIRCTKLLDWCLDNPTTKLTNAQVYNYLSGKTDNIGE